MKHNYFFGKNFAKIEEDSAIKNQIKEELKTYLVEDKVSVYN